MTEPPVHYRHVASAICTPAPVTAAREEREPAASAHRPAPHGTRHGISRTPSNEGIIVNTTTLTAARPTPGRTTLYQPRSLDLQDRVARRIGLALLDWSRKREAMRSPEAVLLRRQGADEANAARDEQRRLLYTVGNPVI
jgi:hypothetical protein